MKINSKNIRMKAESVSYIITSSSYSIRASQTKKFKESLNEKQERETAPVAGGWELPEVRTCLSNNCGHTFFIIFLYLQNAE